MVWYYIYDIISEDGFPENLSTYAVMAGAISSFYAIGYD